MASDEHPQSMAQRFGWPVATGTVVATVGATVGGIVAIVFGAAVKKDVFSAIAVIACLAVLVAWLTVATLTGAAARRRIDELEQRAAEQREELDRLQVLMGWVTRAALPTWLLVAIRHTERTGGRIDAVPAGLRFVAATADGEWTVELPLSTDDTAQRLTRDGLHRALGIGQREYTTALIESTR